MYKHIVTHIDLVKKVFYICFFSGGVLLNLA